MKKKLLWLSCLLFCGALLAMEPENNEKLPYQVAEILAKLYPEGRGRWVRLLEEVLPGDIPSSSATGISQTIAQEVLRNGPPIREFILSQISLPFKECIGHTNKVRLAVFNRTGDKVVTASSDGTAKIWETETGRFLLTLEGHTGDVSSAAFNSTGDKVVTASWDGTARIWDTETGKPLHTLVGQTELIHAVFNRKGDKVVTASMDGMAILWDTETGKLLHTLRGHTGGVMSAFNTTGDKVVTFGGLRDKTAKIWKTETGELLYTLVGIDGAMFNQTGDKVVTISCDERAAKIWDAETGELLHTLEEKVGFLYFYSLFNPTVDKIVISPHGPRSGDMLDIETGSLLHTLEHTLEDHPTDFVNSAMFNVTGDKAVTASDDRTARIWDLGPLLTCQKFLTEDITLYQVAILNDIFEVRRAWEERGVEDVTFDFNKYPQDKYPHLWDDYASLPEAIRMIFDPYITKPSSN